MDLTFYTPINHCDMVHRKKILLAESRGSSRFLSFNKNSFLILDNSKKFLFTGAIFERIFPPRGAFYDLFDPCFPYTFCPSFITPIGFGGYTSKNF